MSATFPLVTFSLVLSAFVSTAPASNRARKLEKLACSYSDQYFRVSDGISTWEKYVANWDQKEAKLECGERIAAGLIGSYFVFFTDGKIKDLYVGSFAEDSRVIALKGDLAAAAAGAYFITARTGGEILSTMIGNPYETPKIAITDHLAATVMGTSFVVSDGLKTADQYVGGGTETKIAATADSVAALTGNHFVAYVDGKVLEKDLRARAPEDTIAAGGSLIAASAAGSFVVLDSKRGVIQEKEVGAPGTVRVVNDVATHESTRKRVTRYSAASGTFTP